MLRTLLIALALISAAGCARATPVITDVEICDGAFRGCRPAPGGRIDPQGRLIGVRAKISGLPDEPVQLWMSAVAASEVRFNGVLVARNGRPGASAAAETPGRLDLAVSLPEELWRPNGNSLTLRLSSFHAPMALRIPVSEFRILPASHVIPMRWRTAPALVAAGALLAGFIYFAAVAVLERNRSSALLAGMAGAALLQAAAEMWRALAPYLYPVHPVRLAVILAMAWAFAVLLAAFAAERFLSRRRGVAPGLVALAGALIAFAPSGFDERTAVVLGVGGLAAAGLAAWGVRRRARGARAALACLMVFLALLVIAPQAFLDLSFFLLAALLTLALLVAEVARLRRLTATREVELVRAASQADRLSVATPRGVEVVRLDRITAIVGADDYAELRLADGRTLLHAARLDHLAETLPAGFVRIHRSVIANLAHASRMTRHGSRWVLETPDGSGLPVSRARVNELRTALAAFSEA